MKMRNCHLLIKGNCTKGGRPYKDPDTKKKKKRLKAEAEAAEVAVGVADTHGGSPRHSPIRDEGS